MTEVELKAKLTDNQAAQLPLRLSALGFVPKEPVRELDVYFNAPDRDFRETDEALRLRRLERLDGSARAYITYKGPKQDPRSSTRTEFETGVAHGQTAQSLLEALGYRALLVVDKTRRVFLREAVTVCLDHLAGLGNFVELELLIDDEAGRDRAVDQLLHLLGRLEVSGEALTRASYLELLMAAATEQSSS